MPSYLVTHKTDQTLKLAAMVLTLSQVVLSCAVIGLATAGFLQPDPLAIVTRVLEDFAANQTAILAGHLQQVDTFLANHTLVLARLAEYLSSEETRGTRLAACLANPSNC